MDAPRERLGRWMEWAGLSKGDAATQLKVSRSYLWRMLEGKRTPGLETALRIEELTRQWPEGPIVASEWVAKDDGDEPAAATGTDA